MVECLVWDQDAARSSRVTSITFIKSYNLKLHFGDLRIDNTNKKQDNDLEKYRIATFLVDVT